MTVQIYSKPNCCLCDELKAVALRVKARVAFTLVEVDITQDPSLFERYRYDIPVVFVDGSKAFKHRMTEQAFEERLLRGR